MAINYDFYSTKGLKGAKNDVHVRPISGQTTQTDDLARRIEKGTTATSADIKLVLTALSSAVVNELLSGNRVHIDGLGYFSISINGNITRDKNGKLRLQDASVKDVLFQPERALKAKLADARFTRSQHLGRKSKPAEEPRIEEALQELGRDGAVFSSAQFRERLGLTASTANRILHRLREEGRVENIGTRNSLMLRLTGE